MLIGCMGKHLFRICFVRLNERAVMVRTSWSVFISMVTYLSLPTLYTRACIVSQRMAISGVKGVCMHVILVQHRPNMIS